MDSPRRSAVKPKKTKYGRYVHDVTKDEIESVFMYPAEEACVRLGICLTILKRLCRKFGISRWPYRRLKSGTIFKSEDCSLAWHGSDHETYPPPPTATTHHTTTTTLPPQTEHPYLGPSPFDALAAVASDAAFATSEQTSSLAHHHHHHRPRPRPRRQASLGVSKAVDRARDAYEEFDEQEPLPPTRSEPRNTQAAPTGTTTTATANTMMMMTMTTTDRTSSGERSVAPLPPVPDLGPELQAQQSISGEDHTTTNAFSALLDALGRQHQRALFEHQQQHHTNTAVGSTGAGSVSKALEWLTSRPPPPRTHQQQQQQQGHDAATAASTLAFGLSGSTPSNPFGPSGNGSMYGHYNVPAPAPTPTLPPQSSDDVLAQTVMALTAALTSQQRQKQVASTGGGTTTYQPGAFGGSVPTMPHTHWGSGYALPPPGPHPHPHSQSHSHSQPTIPPPSNLAALLQAANVAPVGWGGVPPPPSDQHHR